MAKLQSPTTQSTSLELDSAGFTTAGQDRYSKSIQDYAKVLFEKSVIHADLNSDGTREVTNDDVKAAAYAIASSFGKSSRPWWLTIVKLGQYLCAGVVGAAANNLDKPYWAIGFVAGFSIGLILYYVENTWTE
jgi:hypothetical protein